MVAELESREVQLVELHSLAMGVKLEGEKVQLVELRSWAKAVMLAKNQLEEPHNLVIIVEKVRKEAH